MSDSSSLPGKRCFIKSKSGLYLAPGTPHQGDYGYPEVQNSHDDQAIWILRWPFDAGPTKGPTVLDQAHPENFHLVHEKTGAGLYWRAFGEPLILVTYYIDARPGGGIIDKTDELEFNCRREYWQVYGQDFWLLCNHDSSHVADILAGASTVGAWTPNRGDNQLWQFIDMAGGTF